MDAKRYEWRLIVILGLTFGFVFFDRNALNYLLPFIVKEIALSNTQIGAAAAILALAWSLSGYVVGWISDRTGKRKMFLVGAVVCFSIASYVTGLASTFLHIMFARAIMGLSDGPVLPLSQTLMASASRPERLGLNMGLMQNVLSNLMGSLVAPLVMVWLATHYGWRSAFYLTAAPGLVLALLIFLFVRDDAGTSTHDAEILNQAPVGAISLRHYAGRWNIACCVVISALMVGWMIVSWVFLPLFLTSAAGFTPTQMSVGMATLGVSGAIAGFLVPGLSDRLGRRPAMIIFSLFGIVVPVAALLFPDRHMILIILLGVGWAAGGTFSLFMATIPAESVGPTELAGAMAIIMGAGELIGGAVAPLFVGWMADIYGLGAPLWAEIILAGSAAAVALLLNETAPSRVADGEAFSLVK